MYQKTVIEFKAIKYSKAPDDGAPGQLVPDCVLGVLAFNKFSVLIRYPSVLIRMTFDLLCRSLPSSTNRTQIYHAQNMLYRALVYNVF